jgi:hypothetical protein
VRCVALAFVLALALALPAGPTRASALVDWNAVADVDTIEVVTIDPGGQPRVTTVGLAVVGGRGYVRSSGTRWLDDLGRDPDLLVRIGADELPLRAMRVHDSETREAVAAAFREKDGLGGLLLDVVRTLRGGPTFLRLEPRTSLSATP